MDYRTVYSQRDIVFLVEILLCVLVSSIVPCNQKKRKKLTNDGFGWSSNFLLSAAIGREAQQKNIFLN
jgi:hypothetical protein